MPNRNYERGRRFEYETKRRWERNGFTVLRTAGSHGFADLVAVRPFQPVHFIQCKVTEKESVGLKLRNEFMENPPLTPCGRYAQFLVVKVIGGELIEVCT